MKIIRKLSKKRLNIEANKIGRSIMVDIANIMTEKKIKVEEISRELNISDQKFFCQKTPTLEQLIRICHYLDIDPVDLFNKHYHEHTVIY